MIADRSASAQLTQAAQAASGAGFLDETYVPKSTLRLHFARFLLLFFLVPAALYLAMFALVRVPALGYERWGLSKWGPVLNYPFHVQHLDADVVIFGDSTAFLGIDPRLIRQETGLKTMVMPNTIGSLPVINDLALERYLRQNKTPRLLVFYFTPWNLDYEHHIQKRLNFEGEEMLLRNGTWRDIAGYAVRHPVQLLAFPLQLNSTIGLNNLREALHGSRAADVSQALGHRDYTEPWPPMSAACVIPDHYLDQTGFASLQTLVRKYQARNIQVAVYLAPVPGCRNAARVTQRSFGDLAAAAPVTLPPPDFADDGFFGHLRPQEVPLASHLFAQALVSETKRARASH